MIPHATLHIRLAAGQIQPKQGSIAANVFTGGPNTLLNWLESQLGLQPQNIRIAERITQYATALESVKESVISESMAVDRWATATELLRRRDELLLADWDTSADDNIPALVQNLATAENKSPAAIPSIAGRLMAILEALNNGAILPVHECILQDPINKWPTRWQQVLGQLQITSTPEPTAQAPAKSALRFAQDTVLTGKTDQATAAPQDKSFRYLQTRSETTAIEAVAAILAESPNRLASTVICCEDGQLAIRLDAALARLGLPTLGAATSTQAHPILQILPLTLSLCFQPVDPQALLDFLNLPVLPIPKRAARKLASALAEQPGLGSSEWENALDLIYARDKEDPESNGELQTRIESWLYNNRIDRGEHIPTYLLSDRCKLLSQWATTRAQQMDKDPDANRDIIMALKKAAGHASLVDELASCQGETISEPQLARLVEEAIGSGAQSRPQLQCDGAPLLVKSLAEINAPYSHLIWLGLGTHDAKRSRWSSANLRMFNEAGIQLDDGSNRLSSLRGSEARGFCQISEAMLAIAVPSDFDKRFHPIWLSSRSILFADGKDEPDPIMLEEYITQGIDDDLGPFTLPTGMKTIEPPQPERNEWDIPAELMQDRETASATELETRLGCPLKWTLGYQARLYGSSVAQLPDGVQLYGLFLHSVLEQVFSGGGELPTPKTAAKKVVAMFDKQLATEAAPLAQPQQYATTNKLRKQIHYATQVFIESLRDGDYGIIGLEVEIDGDVFGKQLRGQIDCLAKRPDGKQAIIDFKFGGHNKYTKMLEEGKAVQLATYAHSQRDAAGNYPAVAYLILANGRFVTPNGSAIKGGDGLQTVDGPPISEVWDKFVKAIEKCGTWLTTAAKVPAWPLHSPHQWPKGVELVLQDDLKIDESQTPCRYCDYTKICGIQRLE